MTRVLTEAQKKTIFVAIPASVTIDTTQINASKIWFNQKITSYPTVSLNISTDGTVSEIRDLSEGVGYYTSIFTIHVIAEHQDGLNGVVIAEALANEIIQEIESWTTPLSGDIRILSPDDIKSLQNLGQFEEKSDVFDFVISVTLHHS